MGQIFTCDICHQVIKDKAKKYRLLLQEIGDLTKIQDREDAINCYNDIIRNTEDKEICDKCKKILNYLFNIRKEKMKKILKEIESSYKPLDTPYCKCNNFQDTGEIIDGNKTGICYVCGGIEKPLSAEELKKLIEEGDSK